MGLIESVIVQLKVMPAKELVESNVKLVRFRILL